MNVCYPGLKTNTMAAPRVLQYIKVGTCTGKVMVEVRRMEKAPMPTGKKVISEEAVASLF